MSPVFQMIAAAALASAPADVEPDEAAYQGQSAGVRVYEFEDDDIEGEVLSADGANIMTRADVRHASLISLRPHFIRELIFLALDT